MFDNFRNAPEEPETFEDAVDSANAAEPREPESRMFGLTSKQRLLISILLFLAVIVAGVACLVVTQRIYY